MLLQVALNGGRLRIDGPTIPLTAAELAADAALCVAEGATAIHLHPRNSFGGETLRPADVRAAVAAVRAAQPHPVGVTTRQEIEPDGPRRKTLLGVWGAEVGWASVNLVEDESPEIIRILLARGLSIEAGIASREDAQRLIASGLGQWVHRILIEPADSDAASALVTAASIHAVLDSAGSSVARLQHGADESAWPLLTDAVSRGLATRIGFEDTLLLPDGRPAADNSELVAAARRLGAGSP